MTLSWTVSTTWSIARHRLVREVASRAGPRRCPGPSRRGPYPWCACGTAGHATRGEPAHADDARARVRADDGADLGDDHRVGRSRRRSSRSTTTPRSSASPPADREPVERRGRLGARGEVLERARPGALAAAFDDHAVAHRQDRLDAEHGAEQRLRAAHAAALDEVVQRVEHADEARASRTRALACAAISSTPAPVAASSAASRASSPSAAVTKPRVDDADRDAVLHRVRAERRPPGRSPRARRTA